MLEKSCLHVRVLCCVLLLSVHNGYVLGQVEDVDVCEAHYKRCQDDNYCSYMFEMRKGSDENCPEFAELTLNLRQIQDRIQKQADLLEEAITDFEEKREDQYDLYEKLQSLQLKLWDHTEKLDKHEQLIERQQLQIDRITDHFVEWQGQIEEMWSNIESQSWVQQLHYQMERQQYDFQLLKQSVQMQQEEMGEQQDNFEEQQSSMWTTMQEWLTDHQNSLIESIRFAQPPLGDDPVIQQQWEVINQIQAENHEQTNNLEKYQQQLVCLEDNTMTMDKKLQDMHQPSQYAPVITPSTQCTQREMHGYFHRYNSIMAYNETSGSPPRDVLKFRINNRHFIAFIYSKHCEIFEFKNKTFSLHQKLEFEDQTGYPSLNHFGVYAEIQSRHMLVIGHASEFGHIVYIWVNSKFVQNQLLEAQDKGAKEWAFFSIKIGYGNMYFLAVSENREQYNGKYTSETESTIYSWNGHLFVPFQTIATSGARTVTSFDIGDDTYLAFGSSYLLDAEEPYNVRPEIYKYDPAMSKFVHYETLPNPGWTTHLATFSAGGNFYLLDVKFMDVKGTYDTESPLYMWDDNAKGFRIFQNIPTQGATKACPFRAGDEQYFVVMNSWGDTEGSKDDSSLIYRYNGQKFIPWQVLGGRLATTCATFEEDGKTYLVIRKSVFDLRP